MPKRYRVPLTALLKRSKDIKRLVDIGCVIEVTHHGAHYFEIHKSVGEVENLPPTDSISSIIVHPAPNIEGTYVEPYEEPPKEEEDGEEAVEKVEKSTPKIPAPPAAEPALKVFRKVPEFEPIRPGETQEEFSERLAKSVEEMLE